ncbi:MAG TPA: hypothetical protein VMU36_07915 [Spirochaetia bacterium]|nr:hypothetical protein [Spirochaetia bacterium]
MKNGPSAAAVLAGGIGLAIYGIVSTLAEAIAAFSKALTWSKPVGALSGKTIIGVLAWLVAWLILGLVWKDREVNYRPVIVLAVILLAVGLLTTFPPFFDLFAAD